MTRINADLAPMILTDQHLMAEYNETAMVYASLRRSRRAQSDSKLISRIPKSYTLNAGHVLFFYDKLEFLERRYNSLIDELKRRDYNLNPNRKIVLDGEFPSYFYNDWASTSCDREIISERIVERINRKPHWYRYNGTAISDDFIENMYGKFIRRNHG